MIASDIITPFKFISRRGCHRRNSDRHARLSPIVRLPGIPHRPSHLLSYKKRKRIGKESLSASNCLPALAVFLLVDSSDNLFVQIIQRFIRPGFRQRIVHFFYFFLCHWFWSEESLSSFPEFFSNSVLGVSSSAFAIGRSLTGSVVLTLISASTAFLSFLAAS